MDYKTLMDIAILAGKIMLESNAETYRVEDTMNHILQTSNFETTEALSIATGLVATLDDPSIDDPITIVKRINSIATNLSNIAEVNTISRQLTRGEIAIPEAYAALQNISKVQYKQSHKDIAISILAASFALLLGGGALEMVAAGVNGALLALVLKGEKRLGVGSFVRNVVSSAVISIGAGLMQMFLFPTLNMNLVITSTIMPLVPGTAITNAIRDTLQGDYTSGGAKALEAFVVALSIALGVAIGLVIIGGGIF
ncbi:threonine/serine ThrE exporter family protein [Carnobacterium funditum]|uniref:threonine/serine ThrE exporter family protein n=1 Tax=Carnobacterium funditum TaxID=2752 RepID=UPI00055132FD|nr:threonine/serine exporter family protein [Carnobacterium funditum]